MNKDLEERVLKSLQEGYKPEEIVRAMKEDGYTEEKINKVVKQAQKDLNQQGQNSKQIRQRNQKKQRAEQQSSQQNNLERKNQQQNNSQPDIQSKQDSMDVGKDSVGKSNPESELGVEDNFALIMVLSIFFPPIAYYLLGRTKTSLINFFTFNFLSLGMIIVPIHCYKIMK